MKIAIIGGDLRIVKLAKILAKENTIITYGLENVAELKTAKNIILANSLEEALKQANIIIGPLPFSKDEINIVAPFTNNNIPINTLMQNMQTKILIAGAISNKIKQLAEDNHIKIIDLMDQEELTVLNTIATAEGAIQVAMENTQKIIHGSNVLVLGFGRVGKAVAQKFAGLSANVTCAVRKPKDFAWVEVYGYNSININNLANNLSEYDIIINTPPTLILTKERLKYVKKGCLIIDLASKPGGVDVNAVEELKINFKWALALPGKVAPVTAAEHINIVLTKILEELSA